MWGGELTRTGERGAYCASAEAAQSPADVEAGKTFNRYFQLWQWYYSVLLPATVIPGHGSPSCVLFYLTFFYPIC